MDPQEHVYDLDMGQIMEDVIEALKERGYDFQPGPNCFRWTVHTRWSRGAAQGEIGGMLQYGINRWLVEMEDL